jgi:hypothetical protein
VGSNCPSIRENPLSIGQGRPVSRILLYPAIHLRGIPPGSPKGAAPTSRTLRVRAIWLARTGGLPGRSLQLSPRDTAGGLLPHPFTHHLCHGEPRPSAGLLSVALDVTEGLRPSVPRVPLARAASATSPDFALRPGDKPQNAATGRPTLTWRIIPYEPACELLALPRRTSTILVGVRRSSTLSMLFQRSCQRGSFPTSGSNQTPGPEGSSTPS